MKKVQVLFSMNFIRNKFNSLPKMVKLLPNIVKNYQKKKYDKLRVNLLTDLDNRYQKWLNHYQF
jgi:hypothetical protein